MTGVAETLAMTGVPEDVPLARRIVDELPGLRAYLRRASGGAGEVEDLAQETVARALKYAHSFDPERDLGRWLRGVALRVLIDQRARSQRSLSLVEHAPEASALPPAEYEQREDVARLLSKLSPIERDVLVRFHMREEAVREIATALGLPEGTVKSHLHRARRRIAESEGP